MGGAVIGLRPGEAAPCQVGEGREGGGGGGLGPLGGCGGGGSGAAGGGAGASGGGDSLVGGDRLQRPLLCRFTPVQPVSHLLSGERCRGRAYGGGGGGRRRRGAAVNGRGWGGAQRNAGGARG